MRRCSKDTAVKAKRYRCEYARYNAATACGIEARGEVQASRRRVIARPTRFCGRCALCGCCIASFDRLRRPLLYMPAAMPLATNATRASVRRATAIHRCHYMESAITMLFTGTSNDVRCCRATRGARYIRHMAARRVPTAYLRCLARYATRIRGKAVPIVTGVVYAQQQGAKVAKRLCCC